MTTFDVINPATKQTAATVPLASLAETDTAITRAHAATESWHAVTPADQARLPHRSPAETEATNTRTHATPQSSTRPKESR